MSVISFYYSKPRLRVIKRYHVSKWDLTASVYIRYQLPVIKPSASGATCDMIGYFRELHLNLSGSSLVEVAKHYAQDDSTQQLPSMLASV